jgi:internalin A
MNGMSRWYSPASATSGIEPTEDIECPSPSTVGILFPESATIMKNKHIQFALVIILGLVMPTVAADAKKKDPDKKAAAPKAKPKSVFADKNLEKAVRRQVFAKRDNDEPLTADDVAQVAVVQGRGMQIRSLAGLEHCHALASLDLTDNEIVDIAPIKGLPRLQQLILATNKVADISPLKANPALQYVDLNHNQVSDISACSGLTNLAVLYLSDNRIKTVSPVCDLPKLHSLYLDRNGISRLDGVNRLRWLSSFSAAGNKITDLAPLQGLDNLSFVYLVKNQIAEIGPLLASLKADYEGAQRFAPYANIYLAGNPLSAASKTAMERFRQQYHTRFK